MTSIDKSQPLPIYYQLKEILQQRIDSLESGSRGISSPSERDLCNEHGISHMTVRQAIVALVNEGRYKYANRAKAPSWPSPKLSSGLAQ